MRRKIKHLSNNVLNVFAVFKFKEIEIEQDGGELIAALGDLLHNLFHGVGFLRS
jgi:hypothetical protein